MLMGVIQGVDKRRGPTGLIWKIGNGKAMGIKKLYIHIGHHIRGIRWRVLYGDLKAYLG